jgi:hypothetical protein
MAALRRYLERRRVLRLITELERMGEASASPARKRSGRRTFG